MQLGERILWTNRNKFQCRIKEQARDTQQGYMEGSAVVEHQDGEYHVNYEKVKDPATTTLYHQR